MWALFSIRQTVYDKFQTVIKAAQILQEISVAAVNKLPLMLQLQGAAIEALRVLKVRVPPG